MSLTLVSLNRTTAVKLTIDQAAAIGGRGWGATDCPCTVIRPVRHHLASCSRMGPSAQDERRFAARVLADVIGDADGSRFYWALVDNAIAEEADFGFYPHDGCGSFYLSLTTDPQRSGEALKLALAELQAAKSNLNEPEVERAKNKIASGIVLEGEVPLGRLRAIASQWIYNHEYRSLETDMSTLMSVSADSLRALMKDFPFDPMTIVSLGPEKK